MFVEFKSRGAQLSESQRDTMNMVGEIFRNDRDTPTKRAKRRIAEVPNEVYSTILKRKVGVKAFGYHLVRLSGPTPDDSAEIFWDKKAVNPEMLVKLLRFDLNPDSLNPMDWRIHHKPKPEILLPFPTLEGAHEHRTHETTLGIH